MSALLFSALNTAVRDLAAQSKLQATGSKSTGAQFGTVLTVLNVGSNNQGGVHTTPCHQTGVQGNMTPSSTTTASVHNSTLSNGPVPTTSATYDANLPANAPTGYTSTGSTLQVYDSLGATHDMTYRWTKTGSNAWDLTVTVPGAVATTATNSAGVVTTTHSDYVSTVPFKFNSSNNSGTIASIASGTGYTVAAAPKAAITVPMAFQGASAQNVVLNFGTLNSPTGLTQFAGTNVSVNSFMQNGLPATSHVNTGEGIGCVGLSGQATGPHPHFEVHIHGNQGNSMSVSLPTGRNLGGKLLADFHAAGQARNLPGILPYLYQAHIRRI